MYRNIVHCIAAERGLKGWKCIAIHCCVLQWAGLAGQAAVSRHEQTRPRHCRLPGHDTAQQAQGRGARGTGAGRAAWARCWAAGCALGALSLFLTRFDSVLFLSQFLDIVCEPGS